MHTSKTLLTTATAIAAAGSARNAHAASSSQEDFLRQLASADPRVNAAAIDAAPLQQPTILPALAELLSDDDFELARRSKRAMQRIVRRATAPGGSTSRARTVERELIRGLSGARDKEARRAILWMLSEIGHGEAIAAVAHYLRDPQLREDARCVLLRIPDRKALAVLEAAHQWAPPDFKAALAYSLNQRGRKLPEAFDPRAPRQETTVRPLSPPK